MTKFEYSLDSDDALGQLLTIKPLENYTLENFRRRLIIELVAVFGEITSDCEIEGIHGTKMTFYDGNEIVILVAAGSVQILASESFQMTYITDVLNDRVYAKMIKWSRFWSIAKSVKTRI